MPNVNGEATDPEIANVVWHGIGARLRSVPFETQKILAALKAASADSAN